MISSSIKDVAAVAGVSVGTVSNVLNRPEVVSPDTVERVTRAMEKLSYVRNEAARQLRLGHSTTIGLITQSGGNPFYTDIAEAAEDTAAEAGFSVIVGNSNEHAEREKNYLELFEELRVRGVLIAPVADPALHLRRLRNRGIPAVLLDSVSSDSSFSSVAVDDVAGGELAAGHLLESGRRRLAFVGGPLSLRQVSHRLAGTRRAVAGYTGASLEVIAIDGLTVQHGRTAGHEIASRNPDVLPDAIFAGNDLVAIGLSQALIDEGVKIPEQVAVVGYDDIAFASASTVPLSSVRQPSHLIGQTGIEILLSEQGAEIEPQHIQFQPSLVVRASSR